MAGSYISNTELHICLQIKGGCMIGNEYNEIGMNIDKQERIIRYDNQYKHFGAFMVVCIVLVTTEIHCSLSRSIMVIKEESDTIECRCW